MDEFVPNADVFGSAWEGSVPSACPRTLRIVRSKTPPHHACSFVKHACLHEGAGAYRDIAAQAAQGRGSLWDPGYGGYAGLLGARPLLLSW